MQEPFNGDEATISEYNSFAYQWFKEIDDSTWIIGNVLIRRSDHLSEFTSW
jgi:hypothetical protein